MTAMAQKPRRSSVAQASRLHALFERAGAVGVPSRMQPGRLGYILAFTRIELVAVLAALALLGAIALPTLAKSREPGRRVTCVNNLRQIARGWLMWAGEHGGLGPPDVATVDGGTRGNQNIYAHFLVASNEIGSPTLLVCPSDDRQQVAATWAQFDSPPFRNNAASYFAGLHIGIQQWQTLLSGDPNLLGLQATRCGPASVQASYGDPSNRNLGWNEADRHPGSGNLAFSDGSVVQTGKDLRTNWPKPYLDAYQEHILLPP